MNSHEYDRSKLGVCAGAGVKECWLALRPEQRMEPHQQPADEQFAECVVHGPGGSLTTTAVPSSTVDLGSLLAAG